MGINANVFLAQLGQESSWNPNAVNGNAVGLGQFMPGTGATYGLADRTDPFASIAAAAHYDADLLAKNGGDYMAMLASYGTISNDPGSDVGPGSSTYDKFASLTGQSLPGADNSIFGKVKSWFSNGVDNVGAVLVGGLFVAAGLYGMVK
jgi:soluble lytic murein transglycosylase-like protein